MTKKKAKTGIVWVVKGQRQPIAGTAKTRLFVQSVDRVQLVGPAVEPVVLWDREVAARVKEESRQHYERGRKTLAASSKGGDERARLYRQGESTMLQAAREYKARRPKASVREVATRLERGGYGHRETLRKNEKLKALFLKHKKSG